MTNPYRQYQKTAVTTASREKILLMLYEGAIKLTRQARHAMIEGKIADKGKHISKATAILSELMATLDFKVGGKLASDLENLYIFMIDKLVEGNIQNDPECLTCVEDLLGTLYVAWKDVIENPREDGVPSKTLQPEKYKEYQENISKEANPAEQVKDAKSSTGEFSQGSEKPTLKISA